MGTARAGGIVTGAKPQMPAPGPVGWNLIANVKRLMEERGVSQRRLRRALSEPSVKLPGRAEQ
jgi:hypothetical protein